MSEHLNSPERRHETDEYRINEAIRVSNRSRTIISDAAARVIASQLHEGQASAIYSLASTGAITEGVLYEIDQDMCSKDLEPIARYWAEKLEMYVMVRIQEQNTDVVEGWSNLWLGEQPAPHVSEQTSPDYEARRLRVEGHTEELKQLEQYVDRYVDDIDALSIRRHIITRRAAVVAMAVRQAEGAEIDTTSEVRLYGRTIEQWHRFLTGDNLVVPSSRYGRDASECAWWAIANIVIYDAYMGEPDEVDEFANHSMSMVVNDDDEVIHFVRANQHLLPEEVREQLDLEGGQG